MADKDMKKEVEVHEEINKIRMTLRGREVKPLEHACSEIVARGKQQGFKVSGPKRIPTKVLTVTTRRSPCGNGTNTWDRFEMRIHKRVIDIYCPSSAIKEITEFRLDPGVDVNLIVWKQWASAIIWQTLLFSSLIYILQRQFGLWRAILASLNGKFRN